MRARPPSRLCGRFIGLAVALLPAGQRNRYGRELYAELFGMTRAEQVRHAVQVLVHARSLRNALVSSPHQEAVMPTITKPLRCRLGLHRWDERENPETFESYGVCERCDAYRDRLRAAPGTSSGGMFMGIRN